MDISGILLLPSPSSSSHCQKRVTVVTPTVPATLGSHRSAYPTVKAKALSDKTDNHEQNPTKNGQKPPHTRPHALAEISASRTCAPRAATRLHTPSVSLTRQVTRPLRAPRAHTHHTCLLRFTYYHISLRVTSHCHISTRHLLIVDLTRPLTVNFDQVKIFQEDLSYSVFRVDSYFGLRFCI